MPDVKPSSDAARRAVVTVLAGLAFLVFGRMRVLGVPVPTGGGFGADPADLVPPLLAAGLTPFMTAFLLVEVVAFVLPPLREARVTDGVGRARLDRAAWVLGFLFLAVQLFAITRFTRSTLGGRFTEGSLLLQLAVAHVVMLGLVALVTRAGLGHGFAFFQALTLVSALLDVGQSLFQGLQAEAVTPLGVLVAVAMLVGVAWLGVRLARRAAAARGQLPTTAPFPITTTGAVSSAGALLSLPATLAMWVPPAQALQSLLVSSALLYQVLFVCLSLGLATLVGVFAFRPPLVGLMWARWDEEVSSTDASDAARQVLPRALLEGLVVTVGLPLVVMWVSQVFALPVGAMTALLALMVGCMGADLQDEWRARRQHGALVKVLRVQRTAEVAPVLERLQRAGITAHPRSWLFRSTQQFFAPWIPVEVLVPAARAEEARRVLD